MTEKQGVFFLVLAYRIVPPSGEMDAAAKQRFLGIIREALESRPAKVQRQVGLFLGLMRWLPVLRYGAPLDSLPSQHQDAALRWFLDCPIALFRKGFWGMKALILMGFYGRAEIHSSLGYRPSKQGNTQLHA